MQINQSRTQRVMMVAASFRKEVTNTALWLMQFGLRVQCFKVKPYKFNDDVFVDIRRNPDAGSRIFHDWHGAERSGRAIYQRRS